MSRTQQVIIGQAKQKQINKAARKLKEIHELEAEIQEMTSKLNERNIKNLVGMEIEDATISNTNSHESFPLMKNRENFSIMWVRLFC